MEKRAYGYPRQNQIILLYGNGRPYVAVKVKLGNTELEIIMSPEC